MTCHARRLTVLVVLAASVPLGSAAAQPTHARPQGETTSAGTAAIPGYAYGQPGMARSPVSLAELELIQKALLFDQRDVAALRRSKPILADQTDAILDVWYGFVGSHPHLVHFFGRVSDGQPDPAYLAAVRRRFKQWILDTAEARFDQPWLDWQAEIGRRHHRTGKNRTDGAASVAIVSYRYLPAFVYPITATLRPFLAKGGASPTEVDEMQQAWVKAVLLQVVLWSHPYVKEGDF